MKATRALFMSALLFVVTLPPSATAMGRRATTKPVAPKRVSKNGNTQKSTPLIDGAAGSQRPENRFDSEGASDRGSLPTEGHAGGATAGSQGNNLGTAPSDATGTR